jgi:hypothetical protein
MDAFLSAVLRATSSTTSLKAILCHFFSINMEWATTAKELEANEFRIGELDGIVRDFERVLSQSRLTPIPMEEAILQHPFTIVLHARRQHHTL